MGQTVVFELRENREQSLKRLVERRAFTSTYPIPEFGGFYTQIISQGMAVMIAWADEVIDAERVEFCPRSLKECQIVSVGYVASHQHQLKKRLAVFGLAEVLF